MGQFDPIEAPAPEPLGNDAMAADPNADPNAGMDPNAMATDPNAGGEEAPMDSPEEGDDSTNGIISQLSDEDKEAVRNYAKSLLSRDEAQPMGDESGMGEPAAAPDQQGQGVMMEITKGRLKKVQKYLNEKFRENDRDDDQELRKEKKVNDKNFGSPFNKPVKR